LFSVCQIDKLSGGKVSHHGVESKDRYVMRAEKQTMISIHLDPHCERRLAELAHVQGTDPVEFATTILLDYLNFHLPSEPDDAWAEASIALAPEVYEGEDWPERGSDGP
jgi:hypothetical protein